ncbi:MAG: peroxide stress protein YaaA [Bacteroidales bacterium]|nr:peroxide stress protein YaaA [Bacteroidales bacterium]
MVVLISPAKTLNYNIQPQTSIFSLPDFLHESGQIVDVLKKYSPSRLQKLMSINPDLATLNATRFMDWMLPFTPDNAKQAIMVFNGEVYNGLKANTLTEADLLFAQDRLRILSGLYGALRPLDLMQPYRLEMGTSLKVKRKKNLYDFWGNKITGHINTLLESTGAKYLINLASNEYFDAINRKKIKAEIITPVFKDYKNGGYKFLTVYGKKARGMMVRFIIKNRVEDAEQLKLFDDEGYFYNDKLSEGNNWVFTRG